MPITVFKIRTMRGGVEGPRLTSADDPRVTRVGRVIRRYRVDELPQLINVVRGDMSLVGPRPEDPHYVDLTNPLHRKVFTAEPGLTGPAQLIYRNEGDLLRISSDPEQEYREVILPANSGSTRRVGAAGPAGAACDLQARSSPARPAPAAPRGCARIRRGCRYGVGGVRLSTTGWTGTRRRSPAPARRCASSAPMPINCASLCSRASDAVSVFQPSAQRAPGTLFAAICSPLPDPPITMPRLPGIFDRAFGRRDAERRVVVVGVVGVRAAVDRLVPGVFQVVDDGLLEFESGVVTAEVDTHGGHLTFGQTCTLTRSGPDVRFDRVEPFHRLESRPATGRSATGSL